MTNHSSKFTKVQSGEPTDPGVFSLEHDQQTREGLVVGTKVLSHLQSSELPTPEVNAEFLSRSPRNETYREQTCTKVKRAYWIAWDRENQASGEQRRDVAVHISDRYSILTRMVPRVSCHCPRFFFSFGIRNKRSFAKRRAVAEAETASHHSAHWQLPASVFLRNQDVFSCGCQGLVTKQQAVSSIAEIHRGHILTAWWSLTNSWPPNQFIRWLVGVWIRSLLTDA